MANRWLALLGSAALLSSGCATLGHGESKSDTTSAQGAAEKQFQRAADAQKQATEEQRKAEKADREVADAQKSLAEAEAKAKGQHERAAQAQSTAKQLAQEAAQQGSQEQATASQAMTRETAQAKRAAEQRESWRDQKTISGRVVEASGNTLRVRSSDQGDLSLSLVDETSLRVDGRMAKKDQIQPGDEVRASYHMVDGKPQAVQVEVSSNTSSKSIDEARSSQQR